MSQWLSQTVFHLVVGRGIHVVLVVIRHISSYRWSWLPSVWCQGAERESRAKGEEQLRLEADKSTTGSLFGETDGLWNEAGPWPETYRVGLKIPSVPLHSSGGVAPTPLFVNLVVSFRIDAELAASEGAEWAKFDSETRINRDRERQSRQDRKRAALAKALAECKVRCRLPLSLRLHVD